MNILEDRWHGTKTATRCYPMMYPCQPSTKLGAVGRGGLVFYPWSLGKLWLFRPFEYRSPVLLRGLAGVPPERVTGREARGLQTEETGCKWQTFSSLS